MSTPNLTVSPRAGIDDHLDSVLLANEAPPRPNPFTATFALAERALLKMKNSAVEVLFDIMLMPIIFLLVFQYLFGGAFAGSTDDYLQYFLPGVLVVGAVTQTASTGIAVNSDIVKGIFDRFRTMPFWQPAVLVGTMVADLGRYLFALVFTAGLGMLLGYRPEAGALGLILAILLLLLVFSFSFAWIFTVIGVLAKKTETLLTCSMLLMVLAFLSNVFVDSETMPRWMQFIVDINPVSHAATAARGLMKGDVTAGQLLLVLLSSAVLVVIFSPLTMYFYNKRRRG
ncbi:transport permease protein [Nocardia neocaledoniensis NBRC 108232]|uniref:Transport permease protein n=1 Tax=Nocardia neocaledoniensis TaxID=236511 RepID=A0A317N5M9_9NOCA|nr:ABC transporter permease [Nocardia neocaledoniensis]PWV66875.1 ABC-2 type transport system permease protein [Nocardia neocaledoniensis]GEM33876.1 transport permease protein [Nocardia neocaledoniensis NBRC 108232]